MTALPTTPCRQCGKPLVFGKTPDGKTIPMDPKPPCYRAGGGDFFGREVTAERQENVFVTHFATCAQASHFSKGKDGRSPQDEIDELREELRKARDRIAVLEAGRSAATTTAPQTTSTLDACYLCRKPRSICSC